MAFDIITARVKIGLQENDSSKDVILKLTMEQVVSIAEKYCDRKFVFGIGVAEFFNVNYEKRFQLPRYPVKQIASIEGVSVGYQLHQELGMVLFDCPVSSRYIKINYAGGFDPLPGDLELAFWGMFDVVYQQNTSGGVASGLDKIVIQGVGSISYSDNASSGGGTGDTMGGLIPALSLGVLNLYRRYSC